nr:integrase, catalytic region, zinc finger, CCHC-type, peptidase aspartic, catalytic [Tanacetum cinerariifolium]
MNNQPSQRCRERPAVLFDNDRRYHSVMVPPEPADSLRINFKYSGNNSTIIESPPPAPSQPFKENPPLAINLEPVELIISTPPLSPHPFFDSFDDLPPRTTNPPPPQPTFKSIECLANQTPPLPRVMEPPLPSLPPQLPLHSQPMWTTNDFHLLTHEMFCEHHQRTQVIVNDLHDEMSTKASKGRDPNEAAMECRAEVQIPKNNLDNLHSSREEDGTLETVDPQDLLGSFLLADTRGTSAVVVILVKGHAFPTIMKVLPVDFINNVNARVKSKSIKKTLKRKVWKPTGKVFINIGYIWRPTGRTFIIVGNACPLTRITTTAKVPLGKPIALESDTPKHVIGNVMVLRVYFVEGRGHNLFSVGQFYDLDLEVAFRQHTCFIHNLEVVDLLIGSRGNNLSTWSLNVYEMVKLTPGYISSRLVQNLVSPTLYVPPSKKDYEVMFQSLFDEYFNPLPRAVSPDPAAVAAPIAIDQSGSPSSTTIDQDVPSASTFKSLIKVDSSISLTAFADADHAGCQDTRRSTSGSIQFLRDRLTFKIYTSSLLNAACKKSMNLLKKGLLFRGEAKTTSKRRVSRRTTNC